MITVEQGLQILKPFVDSQGRHPHYERTVDKRKFYESSMTGDGLDEYLIHFERRETLEQLGLRKKITNQCVTPPVNEASVKFSKTSRYPNIKKDLYYLTDTDRIKTLQEALNKFCFEGDVQEWIAINYDRRGLIDPNSFLIIDFKSFDVAQNERPEPYGVFVPCDDVVDFEFLPNDELNYLIITRPYIFYTQDGDRVVLTDYYCYCGDDIIVLEEYHEERKMMGELLPDVGVSDYYIYTLSSKAGQVQAFPMGYIKDPSTNYKTFISPLDPAEPVIRDLINDKSEYDQTKRFHVFPQKYQFVDNCQGESEYITCDSGCRPDGAKCKKCNGTGLAPIHTSSSDVLTFRMPKEKNDYFIPLADMSHYSKPEIEIIQHLREDIQNGQREILRAIFTASTAKKPNGGVDIEETATKTVITVDEESNTLLPYCYHKAKCYKFIIKQIALFNDIADGLVIEFEYPKSLRLESVEELQDLLSRMVSAGAPSALIDDIEREIFVKRYIDDPKELNRIEIFNLHRPFRNRKESDVQFAIGQGIVPKWKQVAWANYEAIVAELDEDESFFKKKFAEREKMIRVIAEKMEKELEPEPVEGFLNGKAQVVTPNLN
jgi:hypothetical protein